jgi:hypothetical protein
MITTYAVIYTKPEWTMQTALEHLTKHCGQTQIGCNENDKCFAFTIDKNEEKHETNFLPLSDTVAVIVKDLNLPQPVHVQEEEKEEKKE